MTRRHWLWSLYTGLVLSASCEDPATILLLSSVPDTVVLYSLASPTPNLPNALDLVNRSAVQVETPGATGTWDVAINSSADGFALLPPDALGITAYAAVWVMEGASLQDITLAPSDSTAYVRNRPVPLVLGDAYVVRTRYVTDSYGSVCAYYAKTQLVEADLASFRVTLALQVNPNCNSRNLVPDG